MKQRLVLAAALAATAVPITARAQLWLEDRQYREGVGVRVGDLELHPALGADFGYDNNYFLRADSEDPAATYRLRVTPSLTLSTLGAQRRNSLDQGSPPSATFDAAAFATYHELFAADSNETDLMRSQRHLDLGASLNLKLLPHRPLGADVYADYLWIGEPSNNPEPVDDPRNQFDRGVVRVGPGVTWRPGGGLFEWRLGYEAAYNYLSDNDQYNNVVQAIMTRGRWRFLPRTALLYDAQYRFIRYTNEGADVPADGDVVRARVGITGLVTPRIGLLGILGWSSSFYEGVPQNADTILAQAEAKYYFQKSGSEDPSPVGLSTLAIGYLREIQNSYLSSFYEKDRGYAQLTYYLGGAFVLRVQGGFSHIWFPTGLEYQEFSQNRIDARLFGEYRFSNSFGVNGSFLYDQTMSDTLVPVTMVTTPTDDLDYTRWQVYVGARWFM
jgi:hypothetical protein